MRGFLWLCAALAFACEGTSAAPPPVIFQNAAGTVSVVVATSPFSLVIKDAQGNVLLESDPTAPLSVTHNTDESTTPLVTGFDYYKGEDDPWTAETRVVSATSEGSTATIQLDPPMTVTITSDDIGVRIAAQSGLPDKNRVAMSFVLHDDDHFFGFGEKFVGADQRGQYQYMWTEDRFGAEDAQLDENSPPSTRQSEEEYIPVPWMMNPRGFGMLEHTTYRTEYHLGDPPTPNAWSVTAWESKLDFTVFASADPKRLVQALADVTGHAPDVPDWAFAPRRRADIPVDAELDRLRGAHIPTTAIDTALHYFPSGIGTTDAKAVTADLHARGFKAVAYFCSFVDVTYHPVYDDAVANGYLIKKTDGTPYVVYDYPRNAGMVDFTNPAAVTWYQGFLKQAVDDGWDGWMYDFAEYVPQDAVMYNGMTGMEAHNLYPVLYQKTAHDLMEQLKPKDYMFFVRSGGAGTSGYAPLVWGGDQDTDFSVGKGMPAGIAAALNAGMSAMPFWGSDISGYHYLYNPPPDKELYLRWTELGALSGQMYDENEGAGNQPVSARWQIWDDQESQDVYRKYAQLHTQLAPYLRIAIDQARATGIPIMRHFYLDRPHDPLVWNITDEYMFGDSLLAAPIIKRGATSRSVYLPEAEYYDFFSGARVAGAGNVTANATLDQVPLYARVGAIIPMLSPDVETLLPATDGSGVISLADRSDVLVLEIFSGGTTNIALADGTKVSQTAPSSAYDFTSAPQAQNATLAQAATTSDLATCDACFLDDPASRTMSVTLKTSSDTITIAPLTVTVDSSPNVKRFVMHLHH
jgi:alpha-glucosidase (family GH31 glycosyl hydrolase)